MKMRILFWIKKFFTFEFLAKSLIMLAFSRGLRYLFIIFFGFTFPNISEDPFNIYRFIYIIIMTGFSLVLAKIWKRFFK